MAPDRKGMCGALCQRMMPLHIMYMRAHALYSHVAYHLVIPWLDETGAIACASGHCALKAVVSLEMLFIHRDMSGIHK
jgi:hypothetical protein